MRLHAPVLGQNRIAQNDYKIRNSNLIIPKGTSVSIPTYCIHHDSEYYPDPEKFDPERFTDENKAKRHPMTFTAFGE